MLLTTAAEAPQTFRRAIVLMTVTSFLIPAVGVVTSPILARALDTGGRGELAAALAPSALMLAVATLGLPDALTYHLAKRPSMTRAALTWATVITLALGAVCTLATWVAVPFLSADNARLARFILLATVLTIPALVVGAFRGAATGRQMWGAVAVERLIVTGVKLIGLGGFWLLGDLTVFVAVLVNVIAPILGGLAYWPLLRARPAKDGGEEDEPLDGGPLRTIVGFGSRVWLGSVASMLVARIGQIFMTPLSSVQDLGLYTVASTISDLPLVVAVAIQGALYGVNSKTTDSGQLATTSRVTMLVGAVGCAVLGGTLPFWIEPLFGSTFVAATVPTVMLLVSAVICIPGLMAASGVAAWGRPGLRSLGLAFTLVANFGSFLFLVPRFGVYGACWTSLISNVVMTGFMVIAAARVTGLPAASFVVPRAHDVRLAWGEGVRILQSVTRRRSRRSAAEELPPAPVAVLDEAHLDR